MKKIWSSEVQIIVVAMVFFSIIPIPYSGWQDAMVGPVLVLIAACVYYSAVALSGAIKRLIARA